MRWDIVVDRDFCIWWPREAQLKIRGSVVVVVVVVLVMLVLALGLCCWS